MMKSRKSGSRHTLLFYRRTMDRVLSFTLLLGIVLLVLLVWRNWQVPDQEGTGGDIWLLAGVLVSFGMSLFAFFPRFMFSPRNPGFVLLVPDWMKFSTEIDMLHGNWLQSQRLKK